MRSIEDLTDQIRSRSGRTQFDEAMRAYTAGAYRAATIALWIAVIHDLIRKIRILAESDDKAARTLIDEVEGARTADDVRRMQSIENGLLDRACDDFELVTGREAHELRRLNADRNICAHPSFQDDLEAYNVSPEQVRAYACLVVDAVLSQPAVVGKALVDHFQSDIESDSWPDDDLAEFLRTRYFARARSGAMRNILALATKAAIRPPDDDDRIRSRCVATLHAAAEIDEDLVTSTIADVLEKWRDTVTEDDLIRIIGAVGAMPISWRTLGPDNVSRAGQILRTKAVEDLIDLNAFCSGYPADDTLRDHYTYAVRRLDSERLQDMVRQPFPRRQWVEPVLRQLRDANSWRDGERAMRLVVTVADDLHFNELTDIGAQFLRNRQIHQAFSMPQLLAALVEATESVPGAREMWIEVLDNHLGSRGAETDAGDVRDYADVRRLLNG